MHVTCACAWGMWCMVPIGVLVWLVVAVHRHTRHAPYVSVRGAAVIHVQVHAQSCHFVLMPHRQHAMPSAPDCGFWPACGVCQVAIQSSPRRGSGRPASAAAARSSGWQATTAQRWCHHPSRPRYSTGVANRLCLCREGWHCTARAVCGVSAPLCV